MASTVAAPAPAPAPIIIILVTTVAVALGVAAAAAAAATSCMTLKALTGHLAKPASRIVTKLIFIAQIYCQCCSNSRNELPVSQPVIALTAVGSGR